MDTINVFIADDHDLIRKGLLSILDTRTNINVAGVSPGGKKLYDEIIEAAPDVLILDISMPEINGIEILERISNEQRQIRVIMLSMFGGYDYISKCLEADCAGYIVKTDVSDEIVEAIETVAGGQLYVSSTVQKTIMANYASSMKKEEMPEVEEITLTRREHEVVRMVAQGMTSQQIADTLFVSPRTIDTHRANLMKKLEVNNTVELLNRLRQLDVLSE